MLYHHLPIPPTWVIPVSCFRRVARHNGCEDLDGVEEDEVRRWNLTPEVAEGLSGLIQRIGGAVAVRSSAPQEDGLQDSYAGQYETCLGVDAEGLEAAVKHCWASWFSMRATQYRKQAGASGAGLALVIQPMIEPVVSGVLFSINPLNGSWREMSVEAVWGQCEGLVSGELSPHWYLVRRPKKAPRPLERVLARVRLQVLQEQIHPLTTQFVLEESGGLRQIPVPTRKHHQPTLRHSELFRLCRMGLKMERYFGTPQDVEWALTAAGEFVILQTRPITAQARPRERTDVVWTRRFVGERWPDMATPLGWSIVSPILEYFISYPQTQRALLGGGEALRLFHSRPYLNASVFPHLAFKLPGMPAPHFLLELMPPDEVSLWRRKFAVMPDRSVYYSVLKHTMLERRWERFRWNPFTNYQVWEQFEARFHENSSALGRIPESLPAAVSLVEEQIEWLREYVGIHVCSLLFANIGDQVLEGLLAAWIPEQARRMHRELSTCPPGNLTLACNQALWDLAQQCSESDILALEQGRSLSAGVAAALEGFLARFGNRSDASWEVFSIRWKEQPTRIAPYLRMMREPDTPSPAHQAIRQTEVFDRAIQELDQQLSGVRKRIIRKAVTLVRAYLLLRENQRFVFEELLWSMRTTLRGIGEELVRSGHLGSGEEVQLLEWAELRAAALGELVPAQTQDAVARRKAEREQSAPVNPPDFLRGEEALQVAMGGQRLEGLGISTGRVSGRARVLGSPADGHRLKPGEILIARSVDPGWTPLFATAGGVVLELGGRLSHGAVVAREYGLPAVAQISGITLRIEDGQKLTVDGTQGIVWLETGS